MNLKFLTVLFLRISVFENHPGSSPSAGGAAHIVTPGFIPVARRDHTPVEYRQVRSMFVS
jgi:hypothetical protein